MAGALAAFAAGSSADAGDALAPGPLEKLRSAADVLRPLHGLRRPLWVEFLRGQCEFNHRVVDLLEDGDWLTRAELRRDVVLGRLGPLIARRSNVPRRPGLRGWGVHLSKRAALRTVAPALATEDRRLEAANRAVLSLLAEAAPPRELDGLAALAASLSARWATAPQGGFLEALIATLRAYGPALWGQVAAEEPVPPRAWPTLSVLAVGALRADVPVPDALEILVPAGHELQHPRARVGDVADARGEWILRLGEADVFEGGAAFAAVLGDASAALVFGDVWEAGQRQVTCAWSPEQLWCRNPVGPTFAIRATRARAAGLARAQDPLDWLLRPRFEAGEVRRVSEVTASRREALVRCPEAERGAIDADLARRGIAATTTVEDGRVRTRPVPRAELVSIIVPFRDKIGLLEQLYASLLRHDAGVPWELLLISNGSRERATFDFLASLDPARVRWFSHDAAFNFSRLNNVASRRARGEWLLFLNNDTAVTHRGWLSELLGYAQLEGVGAVGARLTYGDGSLQHAGVAIGLKGLAGHVFARWRPEYGQTPFGFPDDTRNWSAVTGACLLMRRSRFEELGGFDERIAISGGDVELCLRAGRDGSRIVCVGHVRLDHYESVSRGKEPVPLTDLRQEVRAYLPLLIAGDPYYPPPLSLETGSGSLSLSHDTPLDHALRVVAARAP